MTSTNQATFGPLTLTVTDAGEPGDAPRSFGPCSVRKMVARWSLEASGESIAKDAPFYFGTADDPTDAHAADVLQSVLSDLQSIEPHVAVGSGELDEWASWADDLGYFAGDANAKTIRDSIESYQTIRAWRTAIVAAITCDEHYDEHYDEDVYCAVLDVARECTDDVPSINGEELTDAGSVGIGDARAAGDLCNGQRWEDANGNVYGAADVLAARLAS